MAVSRAILGGLLIAACSAKKQPAPAVAKKQEIHVAESDAKTKLARLELADAQDAYVRWLSMADDAACPDTMAPLVAQMARADGNDPWGHPIVLVCGPKAPDLGKDGVYLLSLGADGQRDTADDLRSYETTK